VEVLHIPSFAAPLWPPCPVVVTVHDAIPFALPIYRSSQAMALHVRLLRRTVRRATLILTPSRAAAADIARHLAFPPARIRVTPEAAGSEYRPAANPVDALAEARRLGIDGPFLFNIAGFDRRKNLPLLLEAFATAAPSLDPAMKLVIGGAPHGSNPAISPPIEPEIARLGLQGKVVLTGRVSDAEKVTLYQAAELYVTPSIYEGFGLTALEAMACGTPVIAANRTSLPEVVGDAGLLVEPEVEAFRAAIQRVLGEPELAAGLRARGLERAARFHWRETARLTAAAYHEAAALAMDKERMGG
jgi:glycosyltransferase involved in cell wall biosynthesis